MAPAPKSFDKIIQDGRERKKNESLANKIFSRDRDRDRRQSAPSKLKASPGGSLASRVGVKKPQQQQQQQQKRAARASLPAAAGDVNGEWTHDLHDASIGRGGSLAARVGAPAATATSRRAAKRKAQTAAALDRMDIDGDGAAAAAASSQVNVVNAAKRAPAPPAGITIRGLAGPYSVLAQNFAPGTTEADIESAMTPVGGEMVSCRIVKSKPLMIVEMVFASREGGDRVIETFNDKTADGRLIKVYPKIGGYQPPAGPADQRSGNNAPANAPNGPRGSRKAANDQVIDGSMGFSDDLIQTDNSLASRTNRPLYSDKIVAGNRRGRGFQGGRGGR